VLTGTVDRVEQFGVFVRLGPGQTVWCPTPSLAPAVARIPARVSCRKRDEVLVLAIEEGAARIRLSREKAITHEEQVETQAYLKDVRKTVASHDAGREARPGPQSVTKGSGMARNPGDVLVLMAIAVAGCGFAGVPRMAWAPAGPVRPQVMRG